MKFKLEDFKELQDMAIARYAPLPYAVEMQVMAEHLANAKLKEWLDQAPVVFGHKDRILEDKRGAAIDICDIWTNSRLVSKPANHDQKARLVCIEELVKEPCRHEPFGQPFTHVTYCKQCGVELIAEWKEKK